MRGDWRPYSIRRLQDAWVQFYVNRFIVPAFDEVGGGLSISCPRNLEIYGGQITVGKHAHIHAATIPSNCT